MTETFFYYFDRYFHVLTTFGVILMALFLGADPLIGAVGLRSVYTPVAMAFGIGCLLWLVLALRHDQMSNKAKWGYLLLVVAGVIFVIIFGLLSRWIFALVSLGWMTGLLTGAFFITPNIVIGVFCGIFLLQVLLRFNTRASKVSKSISFLLLVYCGGYFVGIGSIPTYAEAKIEDRAVYDDHQYFLYIQSGWLGDPDILQLYQCNSFGILCKVIYEAPSGYYWEKDLPIVYDSETNRVGVEIDGRISPWELAESDVNYLCAFFEVPLEDRFCNEPTLQDYASFQLMLGRAVERAPNYNNVTPFFERAGTFDISECPLPETVLVGSRKEFYCRLQFPDSQLYINLRMYKYGSELENARTYYTFSLVNPVCHCDNEAADM